MIRHWTWTLQVEQTLYSGPTFDAMSTTRTTSAHRTRPVSGSGPPKPKFRLDKKSRETFVLGVVPIHGTHVIAMAQRPASGPVLVSRSTRELPPPSSRASFSSDQTNRLPQRLREREREGTTTATMRGWREEVVALSLRGYGNEEDDRPEKPRRYGVTEMRSPFYSLRPANQALQVRCRFAPAPISRRPGPVLCSNPFGIGLRRPGLDVFWFDFERDSVSACPPNANLRHARIVTRLDCCCLG